MSRATSRAKQDEKAQAAAYQEQAAAPAAAPAPARPAGDDMTDAIAQIKQLAELHDQGILTDDEFAAQKAKLLG